MQDLTDYQDYDPKTFTYKKLMIKLAFEYILTDLELNQNFELVYEYIKAYGEHLESVNFRIIDKTSLKSNHYWLMAIIPKLTKLKQFRLIAENDKPFT